MKLRLTLGLIAGILGLTGANCGPSVQDLRHAQDILNAANHYTGEQSPNTRRPSRGRLDATRESAQKDTKLLFMQYDGLFYKAGFDRRTYDRPFDGLPDLVITGRWQYENGVKKPSTDFMLLCRIKYGERGYDQNLKVVQDPPKIKCDFHGRNWVTPRYILSRMDGSDVYTTDKMRKEK